MHRILKKLIRKYFEWLQNNINKVLKEDEIKLIFNHLSATEILRCSKVCPKWNKIIASETFLTDRMRVEIIDSHCGMMRRFTAKDADILINSKRQYKHVALYVTRNFTKDHLLLMAKFDWESVVLHNHTFISEIEMTNFFGLIEPTVKELVLLNIRIAVSRKKDITPPNFVFPALKYLSLSNAHTYVASEILKNVETLEELRLETFPQLSFEDYSNLTVERVKAFQSILVKNQQMKKLKLYINQKDFDNMFIDERFLSRIRFKLEEISTHNFQKLSDRETNVVQINNFGKFLVSQKETLQGLYLHQWVGNYVLEIAINNLDSLRYLTVQNVNCYGNDECIANMSLFKNESIEILTLHAKYSRYNELQEILVESCPNLKLLNIGTVNQKVLNVLIDKTLKLEQINMDYFSAYIVPEKNVLPNLKEMNFNFDYAGNFRDMLRGQTYYTNFERVFMEAVDSFDKKGRQRFL